MYTNVLRNTGQKCRHYMVTNKVKLLSDSFSCFIHELLCIGYKILAVCIGNNTIAVSRRQLIKGRV